MLYLNEFQIPCYIKAYVNLTASNKDSWELKLKSLVAIFNMLIVVIF